MGSTSTTYACTNNLNVKQHLGDDEPGRLSKMPEEVRAEISPWFIDKQAIKEDCPEKIAKLDSKARYMDSNL